MHQHIFSFFNTVFEYQTQVFMHVRKIPYGPSMTFKYRPKYSLSGDKLSLIIKQLLLLIPVQSSLSFHKSPPFLFRAQPDVGMVPWSPEHANPRCSLPRGPKSGRYYGSIEGQGYWVSGLAGKSFSRAGENPNSVTVAGRSCLATLEAGVSFHQCQTR